MEVIEQDLAGQELVTAEDLQIKVEHKTALPDGAKKVVCVTCQTYPNQVEPHDDTVTLTGNTVVRTIFMNEFDQYDSAENTMPFESKIAVKDLTALTGICATMQPLQSQWELADNTITATNIVRVLVKGVRAKTERLVTDLTGDVEVQKTEHKILNFHAPLADKFEVTENVPLDENCAGVLGVDAAVYLRDVACADGKVAIKGVVAVNLIAVKTADGTSTPYNQTAEIDFAKTMLAAGVTAADLATGTVCVTGTTMHLENGNNGTALAVQVGLLFQGGTYVYQTFQALTDAISFTQELSFTPGDLTCAEILPQLNNTAEIESNLNLPANTPYVARVLAVSGAQIANCQVTALDGKAQIEGVLAADVLLESEEHLVTNFRAEIPFQTTVRAEKISPDFNVTAAVSPLLLNVKARRGVELLLDAKLGISLACGTTQTLPVIAGVQLGAPKQTDASALRIYIIGDKENLWSLAKRTNLGTTELLNQNPNLANGCTAGDRLVVYHHEKVDLA